MYMRTHGVSKSVWEYVTRKVEARFLIFIERIDWKRHRVRIVKTARVACSNAIQLTSRRWRARTLIRSNETRQVVRTSIVFRYLCGILVVNGCCDRKRKKVNFLIKPTVHRSIKLKIGMIERERMGRNEDSINEFDVENSRIEICK